MRKEEEETKINLKPCPFCKHEQVFNRSGWGRILSIRHKEDCIIAKSRICVQSWFYYEEMKDHEFENAVKKWNAPRV